MWRDMFQVTPTHLPQPRPFCQHRAILPKITHWQKCYHEDQSPMTRIIYTCEGLLKIWHHSRTVAHQWEYSSNSFMYVLCTVCPLHTLTHCSATVVLQYFACTLFLSILQVLTASQIKSSQKLSILVYGSGS